MILTDKPSGFMLSFFAHGVNKESAPRHLGARLTVPIICATVILGLSGLLPDARAQAEPEVTATGARTIALNSDCRTDGLRMQNCIEHGLSGSRI